MERIFGDASQKRAIKIESIRHKGTEKIQPVQDSEWFLEEFFKLKSESFFYYRMRKLDER